MNARLFVFGVWLSSCATTSMSSDFSAVEQTVSNRQSVPKLSLERRHDATEMPQEVKSLLREPLTVDAAVRVALLNNPQARAAMSQLGIARGAMVQAGLLPNPEVEFELRDPGGQQPPQMDVGLELSLSSVWLAPLRAQAAQAVLDAERWRAAGALLDLAYHTRLAVYDVAAREQKLELRLRALEAQQASYEAAVELSRVGNLPALALAQERSAVELARLQVAEAENALLDAREVLTQRLGLFGAHASWRLASPLPLPALPEESEYIEKQAISASLELAEFQGRAEAASRKMAVAKTEGALPHVSAGFHGERDGALWELGAHVTVALPVVDRAQGRQLSAQGEYDTLMALAESRAVQVRSALRTALNRAQSATRRAKHVQERLLPARQQALEQTVLQYNAMQVGVFQVLAAQRAVTETALLQVEATLDAWKARAALDLIAAGRSTPLVWGEVSTSDMQSPESSGGH